MTIAEQVRDACKDSIAYTLAGGYAVHRNKPRTLFPPARVLEDWRNDAGRCTRLVGEYADGSRVIFIYSENRGASLRAVPGANHV